MANAHTVTATDLVIAELAEENADKTTLLAATEQERDTYREMLSVANEQLHRALTLLRRHERARRQALDAALATATSMKEAS